MRKVLALVTVVAVASAASVAAVAAQREKVTELRGLSLELVGQFQNSPLGVTPVTHSHYGYISYMRGIRAFKSAPQDETTALFTFFADGATVRTIVNGPLRVITRIGTISIYRDTSANGNFSNPETFRDGTPVLVARFRQQTILNTVTNGFSTFHQNRITSTVPFDGPDGKVRLGRVGDQFTTRFSGQSNMPGPPSGYIAGYAVSE